LEFRSGRSYVVSPDTYQTFPYHQLIDIFPAVGIYTENDNINIYHINCEIKSYYTMVLAIIPSPKNTVPYSRFPPGDFSTRKYTSFPISFFRKNSRDSHAYGSSWVSLLLVIKKTKNRVNKNSYYKEFKKKKKNNNIISYCPIALLANLGAVMEEKLRVFSRGGPPFGWPRITTVSPDKT
jgi:hypothetical protein